MILVVIEKVSLVQKLKLSHPLSDPVVCVHSIYEH